MRIARQMFDDIVAHALEDAPNECCGLIASLDGEATRVYRALNGKPSPFSYEIDAHDLLRITSAIDDAGWEVGAIYHSHTRSPPKPSQADINLAFYPDALYVIIGVAASEPEVCAYRIFDAKVEGVELAVV